MHQNRVWLIFVAIVGLTMLYFAGRTSYLLFNYYRLDARVPAQAVTWSAKEENEERFRVQGDYTYVVKDVSYQGSTLLSDAYRNQWAANDAIQKNGGQRWIVWYSTSRPSYSSLQKTFPLKECLTTGLLMGIVLYLLGLGYYVSRLHK